MKNQRHLLSLFILMLLPFGSVVAAEGDTIVVLSQDFAAFSEGSEDAPGTTDISASYTGKLRTQLTGWSGSRVYEAGGSLKIGDNGYLQTANTDMSSNGGFLRITFRVKSLEATGGALQLLFNSISTVTATLYLDDGEWTDVEVMCGGGTASSYVRIRPYLIASGMLIDDLKIETSQAFIGTPEATQPTQVSGNAFTATWRVVSGADSYLLDVYSKNGDVKEYVMQDEAVAKPASSFATTHSKQVTGLDADRTYYFTVRAKRDVYVSGYSNEIRVVQVISSLPAPVATAATDVSQTGFTANWNAVDKAIGYEVSLYKREVLENDSTVDVLYDDFSGFTNGTLSSPDYPSVSAIDNYMQDPGWTASSLCAANGYVGLSPYSSSDYLCTPALDLSKSEGKFKVRMNAASYYYGTYKEDSVMVYIYNGGADPVDSVKVMLNGGFTDYVIESDKGAQESYILMQYAGNNKFYLDEFAVTQDLKAGDTAVSLVETKDVGNVTSYRFDVPMSSTVSYSYKVAAYAETVKGNSFTGYYIGSIYSDKSNEIEATYTAPTRIGGIDLNNAKNSDNAWYTLQGVRLNGTPTTKGIYIKGGKKVMVK